MFIFLLRSSKIRQETSLLLFGCIKITPSWWQIHYPKSSTAATAATADPGTPKLLPCSCCQTKPRQPLRDDPPKKWFRMTIAICAICLLDGSFKKLTIDCYLFSNKTCDLVVPVLETFMFVHLKLSSNVKTSQWTCWAHVWKGRKPKTGRFSSIKWIISRCSTFCKNVWSPWFEDIPIPVGADQSNMTLNLRAKLWTLTLDQSRLWSKNQKRAPKSSRPLDKWR